MRIHDAYCQTRGSGYTYKRLRPYYGQKERGEYMEEMVRLIMMGTTVAIGGIGPAVAIGILTGKALEAMGRNPEAAGEIRTTMILGVAFAEAIAIYSLVIALIIRFV